MSVNNKIDDNDNDNDNTTSTSTSTSASNNKHRNSHTNTNSMVRGPGMASASGYVAASRRNQEDYSRTHLLQALSHLSCRQKPWECFRFVMYHLGFVRKRGKE